MQTDFKDYFSGHAADYSQYRPDYPPELFAYLASLVCEHQRAWDCATGNGQAARLLARHFSEVIASDASAEQIAQATAAEGVQYQVASAEQSGLADASVDLITVAQAFHWFDQAAFVQEVRRVLKDGGILAIWTYNLMRIHPDIDRLIDHLYGTVLGDYWAFERNAVEQGYQQVSLPFGEVAVPDFQMQTHWDFEQCIGYLNTWSAVKNYQQKRGVHPLERLYSGLQEAWGDKTQTLQVRWPLSVRVWRK